MKSDPDKQILFFCPYWGLEDISIDEFVSKVAIEGYDGIEVNMLNWNLESVNHFIKLCNNNDLYYITQIAGIFEANFQKYLAVYQEQLEFQMGLSSYFINSHTGSDYFTFEQNCQLLQIASEFSEIQNSKIIHEVHRGRFSYSPTETLKYLHKYPNIKFIADFSHWCVVTESMLENHQTAVNELIKCSFHIHARVGHAQGPQISDPNDAHWKDEVNIHLNWWDAIYEKHILENRVLGITTEFGPPPYMPTIKDKFSQNKQWEQNSYMMQLLKSRWQRNV